MVKPALAASRAVRVLDYLSLHPGRACTLTEIAKALQVSPASMLSVLAALTDGGYLVRHPAHKTYVIGPALVAVGSAAMIQHPVLPAAQHELALVADEIRAQCAASVLMGDDIVAVAVAGRPRRVVTWTRVGSRVPFGAPFGSPFAAFGSEGDRRRWLSAHAATGALQRNLADALAIVRERGYAVAHEEEARERLGRLLLAVEDEPANERLLRELDELLSLQCESFVVVNRAKGRAAAQLEVSHVTVPVFAPSDEVVMILTAGGFGDRLHGAAIEQIAGRLQASAAVIAAHSFGSPSLPKARSRTARQRKPSAR